MQVERIPYNRVCAGLTYYPGAMRFAFEEALNIFQNRDRKGLAYNDDHPITIGDMKEIVNYMDKIWSNEEIYINVKEPTNGI